MTIVFVIIAAIGKSFMDVLQFRFYDMRWNLNREFWNPEISWENKYHMMVKYPHWFPNGIMRLWMKFWRWMFQNPLVFLTDGWHLSQFIFLNSCILAIVCYNPMLDIFGNRGIISIITTMALDYLLYRGIFGIIFWILYNKVLVKYN